MNDENKDIEETKARDLGSMEKAKAPRKTWFFERMGDGMTFPCEIKEAWDICYNRSNWKRRDFRLIGTSDGTTYTWIVREAMTDARRLEPELEKMKAELKKYEGADERLLVEEVVDMEGDPSDTFNEANKQKILRLRKIIDRLNDQLDAKEEEYRLAVKNVVSRATAAELEVAKENTKTRGFEWPDKKANIATPQASDDDRSEILQIMGKRQ